MRVLRGFLAGSSLLRGACSTRHNPTRRRLLDTPASTVNGVADQRPAELPAAPRRHRPQRPLPDVLPDVGRPGGRRARRRSPCVWDTQTEHVHRAPAYRRSPYGHDALGYGMLVEPGLLHVDQLRRGAVAVRGRSRPRSDARPRRQRPDARRIIYMADHSTWNNAQPDRLVPFITGSIATAPTRRGLARLGRRDRGGADRRAGRAPTRPSGGSRITAATSGTTSIRPALSSGTCRARTCRPTGGGCSSPRTGRRRSARIRLANREGTYRQDVFLLRARRLLS